MRGSLFQRNRRGWNGQVGSVLGTTGKITLFLPNVEEFGGMDVVGKRRSGPKDGHRFESGWKRGIFEVKWEGWDLVDQCFSVRLMGVQEKAYPGGST
jgi:hypothetical protein